MSDPLARKIIDPKRLAQALREPRRSGKTVVQCHGCFDIVHPGHLRYLQFARQLGDILVVSLTGDERVEKGPDRPYIPQELRAESLAALEFVDFVVIDPNPTACELLQELRPDVYVKGREYATSSDPRFVREREIVESYDGRVVFHSGDVVFSSTRLIESLDDEAHLDECRLRTLCRRNSIDLASTQALVERFAGLPVVVVGDVIRETYVLCDAREAAGDAPVLSLEKLGQRAYWGGSAAVALQLRALGAKPILIATAGADDISRRLRADLSAKGIDAELLPTTAPLVERRTFVADDSKLFVLNDGASSPVDSACEHRVADRVQPHLPNAALLIWCDHGYGTLTPQIVRSLTPAARRSGVCIAGATFGQRGDVTALREADLLTITERRLRVATNDLGSGLPAVAWNLLDRLSGHTLLVSLHKNGVIGFDGRGDDAPAAPDSPAPQLTRLKSEFVPPFTPYCADLLGTEEAALAVAALTLAGGGLIPIATYLAGAAITLVGAKAGRTRVTAAELTNWIDARPELRAHSRFMPDAATIGDLARIAPPLGDTAGPAARNDAGSTDDDAAPDRHESPTHRGASPASVADSP